MRQYAGFGTAAESNRRYRYLLDQGTTGLSVAFDLPTQIGYDSDDPHAVGEVGRVGVAIDSLEDMEALLEGIPLDRVSTSMTINATAAILLALYVAVARRRGIPAEAALRHRAERHPEGVRGPRHLHLSRRGPRCGWSPTSSPTAPSTCRAGTPSRSPATTSARRGPPRAQEIAFTFAHALEYVRAARRPGLDPDRFGERLSFFFACHSDFIEEVAKFRAARRLWARLVKERFGVDNPKAQQLRFHVQTGGVTLTAQQPDNNVVRVALQALAAVLGGCQSLHTNGKDEALALPTEASARLALRTQQVIAYETGVADTVDPLGGSYAVEAATDALEQEARRLLDRIEAAGRRPARHRAGRDPARDPGVGLPPPAQVESGERVIVGVNRFQEGRGAARRHPAHRPRRWSGPQVERVRALRARRDAGAWSAALDALEERGALRART